MPVHTISAAGSFYILRATLREIRPYQWVKNLLVFVPIITAGTYDQIEVWQSAVIAFAAFSATASAIYILNDLMDLEADRQHPRKRRRPLASGAMPLSLAYVLAPILFIVGAGFRSEEHTSELQSH